MSDTPSTNLYLRPGRLSDILSLVQVLAYGEFAKRTHAGLNAQLRRGPLTADTWTEIGQQHPELFRVLEAERHQSNQETVALISRLVQPAPADSTDDPPKSIPLTPDQTGKLLDLAIELHDRQVQHRDRWKTVLVPMIVAVIAAAAAVISAVVSTSARGREQPQQSAVHPSAAPAKVQPSAPNSTAETDARKSSARGSP